MIKIFEEIEMLCNADKRKSANELQFISAHMLHDFYLSNEKVQEANE